jgi:hypothetical protein
MVFTKVGNYWHHAGLTLMSTVIHILIILNINNILTGIYSKFNLIFLTENCIFRAKGMKMCTLFLKIGYNLKKMILAFYYVFIPLINLSWIQAGYYMVHLKITIAHNILWFWILNEFKMIWNSVLNSERRMVCSWWSFA